MATRATDVEQAAPRRGRPSRVSADDILNASLELFARFGYRGTTIAAIAEAIGVTNPAVFRYFENKAAILEAVLNHIDEDANKPFAEATSAGGLQALRRLADGWTEEDELITRVQIVLRAEALSEGSELHGRFVERNRYIRKRIARALDAGIKSGEIRPDVDSAFEAAALLSFAEGLRVQWFYDDVPLDKYVRKYIDEMIERISL